MLWENVGLLIFSKVEATTTEQNCGMETGVYKMKSMGETEWGNTMHAEKIFE